MSPLLFQIRRHFHFGIKLFCKEVLGLVSYSPHVQISCLVFWSHVLFTSCPHFMPCFLVTCVTQFMSTFHAFFFWRLVKFLMSKQKETRLGQTKGEHNVDFLSEKWGGDPITFISSGVTSGAWFFLERLVGGGGFGGGGERGGPFYFLFVLAASTHVSKFLFLFSPFLV